MKYCSRCLQPDTRPNTRFTGDGICPACDYFEKLQDVDWQERLDILEELLANRPGRPGQMYDCIIGVSGGKDSTRQALWARDKLGLRPLLACLSYPPEQVSERGVDNISNLIEHGFDVVISAPAPQVWRRLMRSGSRPRPAARLPARMSSSTSSSSWTSTRVSRIHATSSRRRPKP